MIGEPRISPAQHIALPNILLNETVVPEFIQDLKTLDLADLLVEARGRQKAAHLTAKRLHARLRNGSAIDNIVDALEPWLGEGA